MTRASSSTRENGYVGETVKLRPGRYRYKFVVDGEWTLDARNQECERNEFGTFDSITEVNHGRQEVQRRKRCH